MFSLLTPISDRMPSKLSAAGIIAMLAARQHGVVSRAQLLDHGIAPTTISRWVRAGHLHTIHRGVYAVGHPNISSEGRWLAAVLACGPHAALSGVSAAALHNLRHQHRGDAAHVCIATGTKREPPGISVHRPRLLDPRDLSSRYGIPATTPTRTLFDLAAVLGRKELGDVFERSEYMEILDRRRLGELLDGASGRRGLGALRALICTEAIPLSRTRSLLERMLLRICREHGLPIPLINVPLLGYEVDFLWPDARFVIETDGGQHVREQRDRDNERDLTLTRAGYLVRRYSDQALKRARVVAQETATILRERDPNSRR